ncbi:hypothetical protein HPB47_022265 [Ixodes persulcatus]|uniref:Uncharacterized protein n=1 Tax=Ixodes persulcatus TaxID=34615 RepID=A0AC60QB79_IXOPE|nr:hypothetical protein HPB47_022265 [Ixodes persulcatus]
MPTVCLVRNCSTTYRIVRPTYGSITCRASNIEEPCGFEPLTATVRTTSATTNIQVWQGLGLDTKHARLKSDAVPTQNLWFSSPPRKRRRSEDTSDWLDVVDVVVEASTSHRMVDGWTQTTRNVVTASCQTDGGDVQTRRNTLVTRAL